MGEVATEVAEQEFERFAEAMDLDVDHSKMDADDRKGFDDAKRTLVRALETGHMTVDDKGQPVLHPTTGAADLTFYEPTGATFMEMDGQKTSHQMGRLIVLIAAMTRVAPKVISSLPNRDFKICKTLVVLFLG